MKESINRRNFIKGGILTGMPAILGEHEAENALTVHEPGRKIPVVKETDVIVCGGGPAGFAAAISAARSGARTTLIEMYGCLGGIWTTGLLSNIIDAGGKPGIMKDLIDRLNLTDAQYAADKYDAEYMKWTLDQMCLEADVHIRLHTRVTSAIMKSKNHVGHITTEGFSGREAWKAKVFIDATGNGDLAALAGCGFDVGEPNTNRVQPMSLMVILSGVEEQDVVKAGFIKPKSISSAAEKERLHQEILTVGIDASYSIPTLIAIRPGMLALMTNHQYGASAYNSEDITNATLEAREEVNRIIEALRRKGGIWKNARIVSTAAQIGIREGRRIHGLYTLSKDDLINGARFDDAVCLVKYMVDIHSLSKTEGGSWHDGGIKMKPYEIPVRSLISKDVGNVMMAGRCISGDFYAHASYRVTGNAVPMGEAAGKVAAKAALTNKLPQQIDWSALK